MGGILAASLQKGLERFATPWYRPRSLRIFRDYTNLSFNDDIWQTIEHALSSSTWFILLASPEAAQSGWVDREVGWWRTNRPASKVCIVLTNGVLRWSNEYGDWDWSRTTALPPSAGGMFGREPLWVDLSSVQNSSQLDRANPALQDGVARIAARLRDVDKEVLVGEHVKYRRRVRRLVQLTVSVLTALMLTTAGIALVADQQRRMAESERRMAQLQQQIATARQLVAQAQSAIDRDPDTALRLILAAHRIHPTDETRSSLFAALTASGYAGTLDQPGSKDLSVASTVDAVTFTPDGNTLAMGTLRTVTLWDMTDRLQPRRIGEPLPAAEGWAAVTSLAFTPDGKTLAAGTSNGTVVLWNLADPVNAKRIGELPTSDASSEVSLAFSPDGHTLATAGLRLILWDLADPTHPQPLGEPFAGRAASIAFTPGGHILAVGNDDGTLSLWDIVNRSLPMHSQHIAAHSKAIKALAYSVSGHMLATGSTDNTVILWNTTNPAQLRRLGPPLMAHTDWVSAVRFTPDEQTLFTGSADRMVLQWNVTDPSAPKQRGQSLGGHAGPVLSLAVSPDGQTLAIGDFYAVVLWDLPRQAGPQLVYPPIARQTSPVTKVGYTPDGKTMIGGTENTTILWDPGEGSSPNATSKPATTSDGSAIGTFVDVCPAGNMLAAVTGSPETGYELTLWDTKDPGQSKSLGRLPIGSGGGQIAFSADGRMLAVAGYQSTDLWDLADPSRPRRIAEPLSGHLSTVNAVAFTADGQILATGGGDGSVLLWDLTNRNRPKQIAYRLTGHRDSISSVTFTPDGHTLIAGSYDNTVLLWDTTDPAQPVRLGQPLSGHTSGVTSAVLSRDGRLMATTSWDRTIIFWDLSNREQPLRIGTAIDTKVYAVLSAAFAPDGKTLAVAGSDGTVSRWDLTNLLDIRDHAVDRACGYTEGGLTRAEWDRHIPALPYQESCPA
jgi:WD40 repeat protein